MKNAVTKHAELRNRFIAMLTESRGGPTDEESAMLDAFLMTESHLTIEAFLVQNDGLFPGINRMQVRRFFALLVDYGKKNLAIFYGAGHLPDMQRRLMSKFKMKRGGQNWLQAWSLEIPEKGSKEDKSKK